MTVASQSTDKMFTSADRIRQLNEIDKDIAQVIQSAGLAIQALTKNQPDHDTSMTGSLEAHKLQFKEAVAKYFALVSSVDVRLRRQIYALEEESLGQGLAGKPGDPTGAGVGSAGSIGAGSGAANPLDVSWLNSRKDTVGMDKEAELWFEARDFVERLAGTPSGELAPNNSVASTEMQVD
ncbi:Uncharacterized protein PECH_007208 [Penicillium ucsense]|uniref:Mediator of RNA polymerase II transcription subunit 11 n=1 Tax=Penicillium ucsense TaxID=2839758 RepID=A0A8J8WGK1_9EURO|nr:Uncharacterized protein PECM_005224 [Penicillium ucsense]KAF7735042.1 Uncharacterized protein PECH_007208 [Penicillium ucsense]